ncbi:hypothetical protein Tco_0979156 [Tanacetum coccineum]
MTNSVILRSIMCVHTDWVTAITAPSTTPTPSFIETVLGEKRTSEHLKKGTCYNFNSLLKPSSSSSSLPPLSSPSAHHTNRKRFAPIGTLNEGPLAMLEDNVKKLKSPKPLPPGPHLTKTQIDSALSLLTDSFYESYGIAKLKSLVKMPHAEFYQLVSDGWKSKTFGHGDEG